MSYLMHLATRGYLLGGVIACGVGAAGVSVYGAVRERRHAVPLFDSGAVVKTETHAVYPCEAFPGFEVAVKNYYVRTGAADSADGGAAEAEAAEAAEARRAATLRGRAEAFARLFSNEPPPLSACEMRQPIYRVREGGGGEEAAPALAAASWPRGCAKYSALVLRGSTPDAERGALRALADAATHQSLVRCSPHSRLVDMNCDADPTYLGAPYLRVMLSALLLVPATVTTLNVAVLGVGAGALPQFLQHYFSRVIDTMHLVDVEPAVFAAAEEQLGLRRRAVHPERVAYHVQDAADFLAQHHQQQPPPLQQRGTVISLEGDSAPPARKAIDVLFVDIFVGSETPERFQSPAFVGQCHAALSGYGVAAFNVCERNDAFVGVCRRVFGPTNVFVIPAPASSNVVVLGRKNYGRRLETADAPAMAHRHFYRAARDLSAAFHLPYDLASHYPLWWRWW